MAILKIARMGHPVLRTPAVPVADVEAMGGELERLIRDMTETLRDAAGVGLAAPQVHVSVRVILLDLPTESTEEGKVEAGTILINPDFTPLGETQDKDWEACLSIPGLRGLVPRYRRIAWQGLDQRGRPIAGEAEGFHARVLQHEIDHLNGALYIDRMPDLSSLIFNDQLKQFAGGAGA